jgi:AraC family transcriptional regulator
MIDWAIVAASLTFYLDPDLLLALADPLLPRAIGTLLWVHGQGAVAGLTPDVHPALLVQTTTTRQVVHVELVPHLPRRDPFRHHMALVLQAAVNAEGVTGRLYAEALANALADHFLRRYAACQHPAPAPPSGLPPFKLRRITAHIQAHLEQALSLVDLAAVAQTSPAHFARLFKQATGRTPHQYVILCRMERAKELLTETTLPLSEVGQQIGYADQSHFTALFRQHVATTPKAYRDATARV